MLFHDLQLLEPAFIPKADGLIKGQCYSHFSPFFLCQCMLCRVYTIKKSQNHKSTWLISISQLTLWRRSGKFNVKFGQISHLFLVFLLLEFEQVNVSWVTAISALNGFNPFHANLPLLYPLKTSTNQWFSNVYRGKKWNIKSEMS